MIKRIITFVICAAALLSTFSLSISCLNLENIDTSPVLSDLKAMNVGGEAFSEKDYPVNKTADYVQIISFLEYGYSELNDQSRYGIYIYVYNPSCMNILDHKRNSIQLAPIRSNGAAATYRSFELQEINRTPNNLFIKYKIADLRLSNSIAYLFDLVDSSERIYGVSGIELKVDGSSQPRDFQVDSRYIYTGYQKEFRKDPNLGTTLNCSAKENFTVRLDLKHTSFLTQTSSEGLGHYNCLSTCYFAVDNYLFEKYGAITGVTCEWYESKIDTILTTSNDVFAAWDQYVGFEIKDVPGATSSVVEGVTYYEVPDLYIFGGSTRPGVLNNTIYSTYGFNVSPSVTSTSVVGGLTVKVLYDRLSTTVPYFYPTKYIPDYTSGELVASSEEVIRMVEKYGLYPIYDNNDLEEGRIYGYNFKDIDLSDPNDQIDLESYKSNHKFWHALWDGIGFGYFAMPDDSYSGIEPIHEITIEDLRLSDKAFSKSLYVSPNDVSEVRRFAIENASNSRVVMLRFAATDYFVDNLNIVDPSTNTKLEEEAVIVRQTYFDDFDVLELRFTDEYGQIAKIPVSADPIDITPGFAGPSDWNVKFFQDLSGPLMLVLSLIFVIILFWVVFKIIDLANNNRRTGKRKK